MVEKKVPVDHKRKKSHKNTAEKNVTIPKTLKTVLLSLAVLFFIGGVSSAAVLVSYIKGAPPFDPEKLNTVETSSVFDKAGLQVTQLHEEQNRVALPLSEIPDHVQKAVIAMEDERFYKHFGFDILGFSRAILVNLRTRSFAQGASTLTQQLAQNAFLTPEKRIKRKVQEIWLSLQMERRYSKEEILEMYLNRMYYGNGAYGVEAASQTYFNKSVRDVTIAEAAMLAGILRWPNQYNPFANEADAVLRMKRALANMRRLGSISKAEYEAALSEELTYGTASTPEYPYPYFIDYVVHHELLQILTDLLGSRDDAYAAIYTGGLRIYTTMDTALQSHVENVLNKADLYPRTWYIDVPKVREAIRANNNTLPADFPAAYINEETGIPQPQSALVLSDPKTGEIWALGGGREYGKNRNELLRYLSQRQPGSAIKPVIAYAPAIEEGVLGAGSALDDAPLIGPGGWYPENYDSQYRGLVTVRNALSWSYNLPAVRAYQMVGLQKGAEYAQKMGLFSFDPAQAVPSWTLGSREVTAMEMAQAYGVFANSGVKMELFTVQRVEDRDGTVIYEHTANPEQVLTPQTTFIVNDILQDVVRSTTARGLQSPRPMAAKTGTTDDARDIYLVAYAPNVVASFWMGYDEKLMGQIVYGWNFSTTVLREVFSELFKTLPVEQFKPRPPGVVSIEVCTKSGLLPTDQCREADTVRADYFLANHVPRLTCDMHVVVDICTASGELAGEYCPPDQVKQQAFFNRPAYITTDGRWVKGAGRAPLDAAEKPPEAVCKLHTAHTGEITSFVATEVRYNRVTLEWEHGGGTAKEFRIDRQGGGGPVSFITDWKKRSYTDETVSPGTPYTYTICAVNNKGDLSAPAAVSVNVPPRPPEDFQADLIINGGFKIKLNWEYEGATISHKFAISRGTVEGSYTPLITLNGIHYEHTDSHALETGKRYYYQIVADLGGIKSEPRFCDVEIP